MHVWTGVFSDSLDFDNRKRVFQIKKKQGTKDEKMKQFSGKISMFRAAIIEIEYIIPI